MPKMRNKSQCISSNRVIYVKYLSYTGCDLYLHYAALSIRKGCMQSLTLQVLVCNKRLPYRNHFTLQLRPGPGFCVFCCLGSYHKLAAIQRKQVLGWVAKSKTPIDVVTRQQKPSHNIDARSFQNFSFSGKNILDSSAPAFQKTGELRKKLKKKYFRELSFLPSRNF